MGYQEMIKKVQLYSGFSDTESRDALEHMVESLAVRLTDGERRDFASQLPEHLADIALSVRSTEDNTKRDIINDFMEFQKISKTRAKKQVHAAWRAINEAVSKGEIRDILSQLPRSITSQLQKI